MNSHIENWIRANAAFRKSSQSNEGNCVEVAKTEIIGVRNSNDPEGPLVFFTRAEWAAFADGMLAGDFDHIL
ncbi:DUF397 domain-containing protein [Amycolatopsis sp. TNS106]|uniref:DUF397 domain-containing protein n=1 Tax=Amycolatopsis sp. TNS106 TaxID=2861750 RepID=UPI001C5A048E|nr:DUF397 domain-containing protein [Amycolatopsis sp. TNS106]QXV60306.1 DUF397 domain-containing protein [Amycolatopsis sp. TNS106]